MVAESRKEYEYRLEREVPLFDRTNEFEVHDDDFTVKTQNGRIDPDGAI